MLKCQNTISFNPLAGLPQLAPSNQKQGCVPTDEDCFALWRKYAMLPNVQKHSLMVAHIATWLAERLQHAGVALSVQLVRASALLHDLAKSYCILHGGGHASLGAAWAVAELRNYALAQGVLTHVCWPWEIPDACHIGQLPFLVIYADKRVKHDQCVTIEQRYEDLLMRYGHTSGACRSILASLEQGRQIENALSTLLGCNLHESTFDCGGLVK